MWRVVLARPEDSGTLLSSELTAPPAPLAPPPLPPPLSGPGPSPHHHLHHHHHHQQQQQQQPHQHQHHWSTQQHYTTLQSAPTSQSHNYGQESSGDNQQPQEGVQQPPRNLKRPLSDSDCDDVFSEESGKEPCSSPGTDSCQHTSRKRRRGMIEKKRRDRINASLGELRRLVPAAARDPHSGKLEKAEILQLTVEHLRTLRNKGAEAYDSTKLAMDYHAVGWGECAAEVGRYLVTMEGLDERDPLRLRLLSHLQSFHRESHPQQPSYEHHQNQHQQQQQTAVPTPTAVAPPLTWPSTQYPGPGQYPTQYGPQQQHGKPYRPWGAELAY